MKNSFADIYSLLQELAWHFGDHGVHGECCGDLSMAEFMALKAAYENCNLSIQEIGNAINFTKSGATRIIDRLETKGYVRRERSSTDGRVCCVPVTDKGSQVIGQIIKKNTNYVEELLQDLDPQVIDNIESAMEILIKSVHRQDIERLKDCDEKGGVIL